MKLLSLFIQCDFLGYQQTFSIGSKSTFKTFFGFLISFIIAIINLTFGVSLFIKLLFHKHPNIVMSTYFDDKIPETQFTQSEIAMTISLQTPDYNYYIDERVYTITVYAISQEIFENGTIITNTTELPLSKCSLFQFEIIPDYFHSLDLENLYCLSPNITTSLKGEYGDKTWKYLQYRFQKCVNTTSNKYHCYTSQEINEKLNGGYLGLFFSQYSVIPNNYALPITVYGKNIIAAFSANYYSDVFLYLKTIEINTDTGLVMDSIKSEKAISYGYHTTLSDARKSSYFLSLTIQISRQKEVFERSYTKLQTVAGEIGGIIKVSLFLGEIVVYFFRSILYQNYITSFFFEKKDNNHAIRSILSNQIKKYKISSTQSNNLNNLHNTTNNNNNTITTNNINNINSNNNNTHKHHLAQPKKYNSVIWTLSDHNDIAVTRNIDKDLPNRLRKKKLFESHIQNNFNKISLNNGTKLKRSLLLNTSHSESRINTTANQHQQTTNNQKATLNSPTKQNVPVRQPYEFSPFWNQLSCGFKDNLYLKGKDFQFSDINKDIEIIHPKKSVQLWMLIGPCLCNKLIKKEIKKLKKRFGRINFLFDGLHYLKNQNDLLMLKRFTLKDKSYFDLFRTYNFELPKKEDVVLFYSSLRKKKRMKDFKQKVFNNDHIRKSTTNSSIDIKLLTSGNIDKDLIM